MARAQGGALPEDTDLAAGDNDNQPDFRDAVTAILLPVELISFSGSATERVNNLEWNTASEINTKEFTIERLEASSTTDWKAIGKVTANGNSSENIHYVFVDKNPLNLSYYRLKIMDFDETFEYSKIISIQRKRTGIEIMNIFPIPTKDEINVQFFTAKTSQIQLKLTNMLGKVVFVEVQEMTTGQSNLKLNLANYPSGIYFLSMGDGRNMKIKKIVKD